MRRNQAYMILAQRLFSAINMNQVKFNKETQHYWMNTWMNNVPPKKKSLLSLTQYQRAWLYKAEISQRMDSMILFSSSSFFILCFSLSVSSWQEGNGEKEWIKERTQNSKLKRFGDKSTSPEYRWKLNSETIPPLMWLLAELFLCSFRWMLPGLLCILSPVNNQNKFRYLV